MPKNALRAVVGLVAIVIAGGCGSKSATSPSGGGSSNSATVTMPAADYGTGNSTFTPNNVTIPAGGSVTWHNDDGQTHTTTSNSPGWDLTVGAGSDITRTFATKGTFTYHCSIHASMTGTIVVK
jgi:plastocyanin